jgi:hypothetical protein
MSNEIAHPKLSVETAVSKYDKFNGLLTAALTVVGLIVTFLFMYWLTSIIRFKPQVTTVFMEEFPFGDEKPEGVEDDVLEPGVEEFPEVEVPQLSQALEAVTNALSSVRANLEHRSGDAAQMGKGRGLGSRDGGDGTGKGDVIPEHKRWKIEYTAKSIDGYAKQLSYFKIDLGAVNKLNNEIVRLVDPGGRGQIVNSSRAQEKKSVYFAHERPQLARWEEAMYKTKGVSMTHSFTVQFYPEETRSRLRQLELAYLNGVNRKLSEVQNTFFKVVSEGSGFEYKVTNVIYRRR